jgi:hypothetical protein
MLAQFEIGCDMYSIKIKGKIFINFKEKSGLGIPLIQIKTRIRKTTQIGTIAVDLIVVDLMPWQY